LLESEKPRLIKKETNEEVYTQYLKGLYTYKEQAFEKSIEYNLKAIELDSTFAPSYAYTALAKIWIINNTHNYNDHDAISEAKAYANKAIHLDPTLAEGYSALALLAWSVDLDFTEAKANFEKSLHLNPSASLIKNRYGYFLLWMADFDKAASLAEDAIKSDPGIITVMLFFLLQVFTKRNLVMQKNILQKEKDYSRVILDLICFILTINSILVNTINSFNPRNF
jgi:tetratricopeptide (TPR) repeat protein